MNTYETSFGKFSSGIGLFALAVATSAHSQDLAVYRGEEVVVTATRIPEKTSQVLQPVTVITAEDISESGQQTLVEVLQARGGVEITSNGGFGQTSGVFIRGANTGHTLVFVDGMRIGSATTGTTAFENIPLDQIERIEIVPGPLSSLYGSDAIGGVVQIFTKSGKYSPGPSVSAGAGAYNTRTAAGGINSRFGDTDFSLNFGAFETDGFSATKASIDPPGTLFPQHNPDRDGYRNTNFSGKIAHHFSPDHEAGLTAFQSQGDTHFDAGPTTDDVNHQTLSAYSFYSRNRLSGTWQSLVRLGSGRDNQVFTGAFPGSFRTDQNQFAWQNDFKLSGGSVIAGIEYLGQRITSDTAYTKTDRNIRSLFAGYRGEYGNHGWQLNARQDDNSQFGNHTTGSLGYGYRVSPAVRVRASAGTGFKAPTFNDLYFPGFSNPNLRPERSRSKEVGLDLQSGSQRFSATLFENRIGDLIVLDATFTPQNLNQARIRGAEFNYQAEIAGVRFAAQVTLQDPVDDATGQLLQRRAREHGSLSASRGFGPWTLGAELVASGARFDSGTEAPDTRMAGYGLVNLTASYTLARDWSVKARWDNVFDKSYELVQHFNTPGSNLFISLQYQPK